MKSRSSAGFWLLISALAISCAAAIGTQWRRTALLRVELERARLETGELARLQAENRQLRERHIAREELERLRNQRAALIQLRAERETPQRSNSGN